MLIQIHGLSTAFRRWAGGGAGNDPYLDIFHHFFRPFFFRKIDPILQIHKGLLQTIASIEFFLGCVITGDNGVIKYDNASWRRHGKQAHF